MQLDRAQNRHFQAALVAMIAAVLVSSQISAAIAGTISGVPDHAQPQWYYCGPASLEDVFDFYGVDIDQYEIADAARTDQNPPVYGTWTSDIRRAAHFSDLSASQGLELELYGRGTNVMGYTGRGLGYAAFEYGFRSPGLGPINALKPLIDAGYPIIVLQEEYAGCNWGHFRVVIGYDDATSTIYTKDSNPNPESYSYSDFLSLWDWSWNMWGLIVCPWEVNLSSPATVTVGDTFTVTATVTYPCPSPFPTGYTAYSSQATITLPAGLSLAMGETASKTLGTGTMTAGSTEIVQWDVDAVSAGGPIDIAVEAEGEVSGSVPAFTTTAGTGGSPTTYPAYTYTDRIGGASEISVTVEPLGEEVHDVEAVSQTVTDNKVMPGDVVDIDVTVRNNGDFTESFDVSCYLDSLLVGTIRVNNLAPGASTVLTFTWDTTGMSMNGYKITALADSAGEIVEINEVNNECTMPSKLFVIPEVPVGSILAVLSMFVALVGYARSKRLRIK